MEDERLPPRGDEGVDRGGVVGVDLLPGASTGNDIRVVAKLDSALDEEEGERPGEEGSGEERDNDVNCHLKGKVR